MIDPDTTIYEYALGTLDEARKASFERELTVREDLRHELRRVTGLLDDLADAQTPLDPDPALRQRLMQAVNRDKPFEGFVDRLTRLFDLTAGRVREIVTSIDEDTRGRWESGGAAGIELMHFDGGPRVASADCGLVRLAPGTAFPMHTHVGDEWALVLQGAVHEDSGCVFYPGDLSFREAGSSHAFRADGPDALILGVVVNGGIQFEAATRD